MILPIDDDYRITSDAYCWTIQRCRHVKGAPLWESISWHPSLPEAVQGLAERLIRTSEAQTLADALDEVKTLSTRLTQALQPHFEVREVNQNARRKR